MFHYKSVTQNREAEYGPQQLMGRYIGYSTGIHCSTTAPPANLFLAKAFNTSIDHSATTTMENFKDLHK